MNIKHSNILDVTEGIIVHQVNNKRVMGKGLALQIKNKYPKHYQDYMKENLSLGSLVTTKINDNLFVVGIVGQDGYGTDKQYTVYEALEKGLEKISKSNLPIHIPYKLGCGLAGGDWNIVSSFISKHCPKATIHDINRETLKEQHGAKKESTIKSKRPTFKVIIAGGRNFNDYERLKRDCDKLLINKRNMGYRIIIISGTAKGADTLGEQYAKEKGYEVLRFPADWTTYGKKAGYIRNVEMSQHADACICFWDNFSRGTRHMIEIARKKEIPTRISYYIDNTRNFI